MMGVTQKRFKHQVIHFHAEFKMEYTERRLTSPQTKDILRSSILTTKLFPLQYQEVHAPDQGLCS
jgi:hypothetical protein